MLPLCNHMHKTTKHRDLEIATRTRTKNASKIFFILRVTTSRFLSVVIRVPLLYKVLQMTNIFRDLLTLAFQLNFSFVLIIVKGGFILPSLHW